MKQISIMIFLTFLASSIASADPKVDATTHYNLGVQYYEKGDDNHALREFSETLRLDSNYANVYYFAGKIYAKNRYYDLAIDKFLKALSLVPDFAEGYNNLGLAYSQQLLRSPSDDKRAIAAYLEAIRLDPCYADPHYNLGNLFYDNADYKEAISEYQEAIRIKPDFAEAHYNLGNTYGHLGGDESGIDEMIIAAKYGNIEAQKWLRKNRISW